MRNPDFNQAKTGSAAATSRARELTVDLGSFAFDAIGGKDDGRGAVPRRLERAIESYLDAREGAPIGWAYPGQVQERSPVVTLAVGIALDGPTFEVLGEEASRQGVSVSQLATHAALWYLARVEAGDIDEDGTPLDAPPPGEVL